MAGPTVLFSDEREGADNLHIQKELIHGDLKLMMQVRKVEARYSSLKSGEERNCMDNCGVCLLRTDSSFGLTAICMQRQSMP